MGTHRSLVEKHYQGMNSGDWDHIDGVFHPDVETSMPGGEPTRGTAAFRATGQVFKRAFPDMKLELFRAVESDNLVIAEGRMTGTHSGPLASPQGEIPPTGRKISFDFADAFETQDGKVVKHRVYFDQMLLLGQLGLLPEPQSV